MKLFSRLALTFCTATLLQFRPRIRSVRINVIVRAEFFRQRFFVLPPANRHRHKSHLPRILESEMSQSADAMHRDHVATARARIAERIVDGDARAHERPGFLGRQFVGNRRHRFRWCDHVFGISTVEIDAGDLTINAHGEISALALRANETMSAVPAHTDALTFLPFDYVLADRIDASSDFMTRHTRILNSRPQTLFDVYVAVANPTRIIFILIKCLRFSFGPSWLSHSCR